MGWFANFLFSAVIFNLSSAREPVCVPTKVLNDGNEIPILALGTWPYTSPPGTPSDAVRQAVVSAIEAGYRHIDTAYIYFTEPQVGQAISECIANGVVDREDIYVTTKLWNDHHKREDVVPALISQLESLNLTYVDMYIIHFPMATTPGLFNTTSLDIDYLETWEGMQEAKSLGLTKSIGVSNFNETQIRRLVANSNVTPAVVEIEVNPTYTNIPLASLYADLGVQVMAYTPFGFSVARNDSVGFTPPPQFYTSDIIKLAGKYNKSPAQIILRYSVDRGLIPIAKSITKSHIYENINIFDFCLTADEVETINKFNIDTRVYKKIMDRACKGFINYPY